MRVLLLFIGLSLGCIWMAIHADSTAHACSCASPRIVSSVPEDGQTEVPTNTVLWINGPWDGTFTLTAEDGPQAKLDVREVGVHTSACGGKLWELIPTRPLAPNTAYTLQVTLEEDPVGVDEIRFTTGPSPLEEGPAALTKAELTLAVSTHTSSCGDDLKLCIRTDAEADAMVLVTPAKPEHAFRVGYFWGAEGQMTVYDRTDCYVLRTRTRIGTVGDSIEVCNVPAVSTDASPYDLDCDDVFAAAERGEFLEPPSDAAAPFDVGDDAGLDAQSPQGDGDADTDESSELDDPDSPGAFESDLSHQRSAEDPTTDATRADSGAGGGCAVRPDAGADAGSMVSLLPLLAWLARRRRRAFSTAARHAKRIGPR